MAGETPNAAKISAQRRAKLGNDRSTNKYYASQQKSVINNALATEATGGKLGQKPKPIATPTQNVNDKSSDKYYANGGSNRRRVKPAGPVPTMPAGPAPKLGRQPKPKPDTGVVPVTGGGNTLTVRKKEDIPKVVNSLPGALSYNETVTVYVSKGNAELLRRVRAAVELLVGRELITEEQYYSVKFLYEPDATKLPAPAVTLPPPVPRGTVAVTDETRDPADFLKLSDAEVHDPIDTSPVIPTEVDLTAPEVTGESLSATHAEDDDEADNEFPEAEPAVPMEPAMGHPGPSGPPGIPGPAKAKRGPKKNKNKGERSGA